MSAIANYTDLKLLGINKPTCSGNGAGDFCDLLYSANPVYIDVSQGRSHMADYKQSIAMLGVVAVAVFSIIFLVLLAYLDSHGRGEPIFPLFYLIFAVFLIVDAFYFAACLKVFSAPLDNVVRFDRKRKVVCFWLEKRQLFGNIHSLKDFINIARDDRIFVEIPWKELTLGISRKQGFTGCEYQPRLFAFQDKISSEPNWRKALRNIDGAPCIVKINYYKFGPRAFEETLQASVAKPLEAIRSYMENGYTPAMRPARWRRFFRPDWRYMFTGLWPEAEGEKPGVGAKFFFFMSDVFMLPAKLCEYFLYWLGTRKAPIPDFPMEIAERNAEDLRRLSLDQYGNHIGLEKGDHSEEINNKAHSGMYVTLNGLAALLSSGFAIFSILWLVNPIYIAFAEMSKVEPQYSLANLLGIFPLLGSDYMVEFLLSLCFYPLCNALSMIIVKLSWPLMKKYNTDTVAWTPAKPLPDSPANQMTDDGRQKTEDRYGL